MKSAAAILVLTGLLSAGCTTIHTSKTLVIKPEPGETQITVTSDVTSHCFLLSTLWCNAQVDLKQVKPKKLKILLCHLKQWLSKNMKLLKIVGNHLKKKANKRSRNYSKR